MTDFYIDINWPSFIKYSYITHQAFIDSAMPFADTCPCISTKSLCIYWIITFNSFLCVGLKVRQDCYTYITNRQHHFQICFWKIKSLWSIWWWSRAIVPIYSMQWWRHERDVTIATMMTHSCCDEPLWPVWLSAISAIMAYCCCCDDHGVMTIVTHSPVWL